MPVASLLLLCALLGASPRPASAQIPTPESFFGFPIGADRQLASADAIEKYFELIASRSDRVKIVDLGPTTEGHRTLAAIVSAPANILKLERIRDVNQRLADPRVMPPDEAKRLAATQPAVLAIGGSIHATEVGGTQAANQLLYELTSATDPQTLDILTNVVIVIIPSLNPDGLRLVTSWYEKEKGTRYEGGPMPWLYHKYVGHDLNRDGFMMNMAENRNLSRFFYTQWHPQVFLTIHQMGTSGPRFFAPPNYDPIDPNYDPIIWREAGLLGSAMTLELQRDRHTGVLSNGMYDYFWPGYEDSVPLGHNTVCLLTEVASAKLATPVVIRADELRGGQKGLPEYKRQINFPDPWPGGPWRLRDIVDYDLSAVRGLLRAVSAYREILVSNFYDMGARAVDTGKRGGPFAFLIPPEQRDPYTARKLEELLLQGGVEIERTLEPFRADGEPYPAGTDLILLAQPYRAYAKTLLERQEYPARRLSPEGPPERPYDVTAWTLPAQMGVEVKTIERTFEPPVTSRLTAATIPPGRVWGDRKADYYLIEAGGNGGAIAANRALGASLPTSWLSDTLEVHGYRYAPGTLVVGNAKAAAPLVAKVAADLGLRVDAVRGKAPAVARPLARARVGLYKPWTESMDEGWTRWLLEQYEFGFRSLADADMRDGNLRAQFDAIILPSATADRLRTGNSSEVVPPEYAGGLGEQGLAALDAFVRAGGTLICLDQSGALAIDLFRLPLRDVARGDNRFFCPGSILRISLDPRQPLAYGMPAESAAFFSFSSAYDAGAATGSGEAPTVQSIATYAKSDLLVSGWLENGQTIAGRSAVVETGVGQGRVVLIGFRAQHRGQSHASFRFLFNALLTSR